jgi:hypothetical protein
MMFLIDDVVEYLSKWNRYDEDWISQTISFITKR